MTSISNCLQALAESTRLRILHLLSLEDLTVAELQEILNMGQSRISTHLAKLKQVGLVEARRAGKNTFYGICMEGQWQKLESLVSEGAEELPDAGKDRKALQLAVAKRKDRAREYFNQLAGKFGRSYCPGRTWRGLAMMMIDFLPPMVIADLGAGEGTLSQLLAKRAKQVIAVDISEKMVEFGQQLAKDHGIANLDFRLGDMENPPIKKASVDLAVLSQALHHAVNPVQVLEAAFAILKPGGRIAVLDLLNHQFEEARELYADVWLGFSEVEMLEMLEKAGFRDAQVGVVARDVENPQFQTILATASK